MGGGRERGAAVPMKPTRRTTARLLIGALRRRIRTRERQLASHRRDLHQARMVADGLAVELQRMTAERDALRRTVHDLSQRLLTYRKAAISAPAVDPKPAPRRGSVPVAFERLELE